MSCKLEPAIWSRGTNQRIACFDRCQLIIAGMSNIKEVRGKLRLYVSFLEYGRHVGQLRRRRRAYAPTSNTASQDNHEKINSWVSFSFPCMMSMGLRLAALWAAGAPLSKALRKSGHNFQKKITHESFKLAFFDMKFQFFVKFINFIANFISYISKCFCVHS